MRTVKELSDALARVGAGVDRVFCEDGDVRNVLYLSGEWKYDTFDVGGRTYFRFWKKRRINSVLIIVGGRMKMDRILDAVAKGGNIPVCHGIRWAFADCDGNERSLYVHRGPFNWRDRGVVRELGNIAHRGYLRMPQ